jgi:2'-5' RNA ligase
MRLFVAVQPPDDVLDLLAALPRPERPGVRWTGRDTWHVTLRFLGEVDDPGPVADALDAAPLPACAAAVGPRVMTLGRQAVCVPVGGLDALAGAVVAATAGFGRPPEDRPFRGHLTLARLRRDRGGSPAGLTGTPVEAAFPVGDVRLVRSHLGPGGPRYEDLHQVPLGHPEGP